MGRARRGRWTEAELLSHDLGPTPSQLPAVVTGLVWGRTQAASLPRPVGLCGFPKKPAPLPPSGGGPRGRQQGPAPPAKGGEKTKWGGGAPEKRTSALVCVHRHS